MKCNLWWHEPKFILYKEFIFEQAEIVDMTLLSKILEQRKMINFIHLTVNFIYFEFDHLKRFKIFSSPNDG